MAEGHTMETYGRGPYNRNIWPHNSQAAAAPSRLADSFVWRGSCTYTTTYIYLVHVLCLTHIIFDMDASLNKRIFLHIPGVTGQNIPPARVYPGIVWPRPVYNPGNILAQANSYSLRPQYTPGYNFAQAIIYPGII